MLYTITIKPVGTTVLNNKITEHFHSKLTMYWFMFKLGVAIQNSYGSVFKNGVFKNRPDPNNEDAVFVGYMHNGEFLPLLNVATEKTPSSSNTAMAF